MQSLRLHKWDNIDSVSSFSVITNDGTASATSVWLLHVWNEIQTAPQPASIYTEGSIDNKR